MRLGALLVITLTLGDAHALTLPRSHRVVLGRSRAVTLIAAPPPPAPNAKGIAVAWGVCGFLGILASAIGRLAPIALQPLLQRDLSLLQWGMCVPHSRLLECAMP